MKYYLNRVNMCLTTMDEYIELLNGEFKITKEKSSYNILLSDDEEDSCIYKYYIELNSIEEFENLRKCLLKYNGSNIIFENEGWDEYCNQYEEPTLIIYDDIIG